VTIAWEIDIDGLTEAFETRGDAVFARLEAEMKAETTNLLSYVKDEKLSGQVLNQRSGNLKNSGFTEVNVLDEEIEGFVGFGLTAPYAPIHEFGGTINIPAVDGKLMVFQVDGKQIFTTRHAAFTVEMSARPYLGPSIDENREGITARLQEAVGEEMAK